MSTGTLPNTLRPYRFETLESFATRLCYVNYLDRQETVRIWRQHPSGPTADHDVGSTLARKLEIAAGLPAGSFDTEPYRQDSPCTCGRACRHCARFLPARYMCLKCAKGQTVTLVNNNRSDLCLLHRRWCGPNTPPQGQLDVGAVRELIDAERRWRQLAERRYLRAEAADRAWLAANEACQPELPGPVRDRWNRLTPGNLPFARAWQAIVYPEVVTITELLCDGAFLGSALHPKHNIYNVYNLVLDRLRSDVHSTYRLGTAARSIIQYLRPACELIDNLLNRRDFHPKAAPTYPLSTHSSICHFCWIWITTRGPIHPPRPQKSSTTVGTGYTSTAPTNSEKTPRDLRPLAAPPPARDASLSWWAISSTVSTPAGACDTPPGRPARRQVAAAGCYCVKNPGHIITRSQSVSRLTPHEWMPIS